MSDNKIAIVGAGITGLTAAWNLKKKGKNADLFEQHGYAGGSIRSEKQNGWLLEYGPNTLLLKDRQVADFLGDIGLWEDRVIANAESSKRYIVKNGELVAVPTSLVDAISTPLFSTTGKLRVLKEPFISKTANPGESVAGFVKRRLGNEILDYALNPFIAGIYANQPEKLSMRHTFPAMYEMEQKYGSLIWGTFAGRNERKKKGRISRELLSFDQGLHQLIDSITDQLDDVHYNHEVKKIRKSGKDWFIQSTFGDHGPYDQVIFNVPLYKWNRNLLPAEPHELDEIGKVEYPPLSVMHLGFKKEDVNHPLEGFGFLVPEKEKLSILGALFSSTLFPGRAPQDHHLLTIFIGGGRQPELAPKDSTELLEIVMNELTGLIGVSEKPVFKEHVFWPRAIPGYHVGYDRVLDTFQSIEERNPGLHLAGNFRDGVSVPDCIKKGIALADKLSS
ncbi:protoporphyrinogen oxidase [Rhodohalobacter sp. 614A]|uniref:protoporphyrinogen oxidase n=1 Tax=Rhodohalobacter sp. 614A TaxID=2908649 RepID=UPI001F2FD188|nr:protoporphyrinogen oxidase [Rhodohalobacter sp. 614A]